MDGRLRVTSYAGPFAQLRVLTCRRLRFKDAFGSRLKLTVATLSSTALADSAPDLGTTTYSRPCSLNFRRLGVPHNNRPPQPYRRESSHTALLYRNALSYPPFFPSPYSYPCASASQTFSPTEKRIRGQAAAHTPQSSQARNDKLAALEAQAWRGTCAWVCTLV